MSPIRVLALLFLLSAPSALSARLIFVDGSLAGDCTTYDYTTRSCTGGTYQAYRTVKGAADVATVGDTVVLRAGAYSEQVVPKNSGTESTPILYSSYIGEQVAITGSSLAPAVMFYNVHHITIQGIGVANVQRWMAVLGSHHITIQACGFANANDAGGSSKTGLFFQSSDYNIIRNCIIQNSTQDNVAFVQSHHNLVEGCRITRATHTLWTIKCGSYNVLRDNYFHNDLEKIGEIYDCDGVGYGDLGYPKVTSLDDTKHNVVEGNIFAYTAFPVDRSPYAGIQHAGQNCIIRGNVFYHCAGPPIDLTLYADEARYTYGNRIYNNVFYDNGFGGISVSGVQGSEYRFADNLCRNNILYCNHFVRHDTRWEWYAVLDNKPVQIITGRAADVRFERNNILDTASDQLWTVAYGDRTSSSNPPPLPLSWWESNVPALFADNMQVDPMFADTATQDFHLKPGSPMIDAGLFLARTVGAETSATMTLNDASSFRDSYGIPGLGGDTIQLEGSAETAVVTSIDYVTNIITLDRPLHWIAGQRLGLKYNGIAPDLGAFESEGTSGVREDASLGDITIYPNPTSGRFLVVFPPGSTPARRVRVIDMYGKVVRPEVQVGSSREMTIDLTDQPAGVYTVVIETERGMIARTCIRQ